MRKQLGLSTIALLAALGVTAPAQAQLLNLGGDGGGISVNLGGDTGTTVTVGGPDALVDVDNSASGGAGTGGGSSSTLIDLGGNDDGDAAVVDLDLFGDDDDDDSLLDLGGDGDVLLDLFGNGTSVGSTGIIDLGDDGDLLDVGDIDGDLFGIDGLLGDGVTGDDVLLDLFGPGDGIVGAGDVTADFSGETSDPNDATLTLDDDTTAVVDLFGTGDGLTDDLGLGGDGIPEVGGGAGGTSANIDILGDGTEILTDLGAGADGEDEVAADGGGINATVDILDLADATETGGGDDDGDGPGGGGDDDDGNGDGNGNGGGDTVAVNPGAVGGGDSNGIALRQPVRVAAVGNANARCFTPNEEQIAFLLQNRNYDMSMSASWATGEVDLVPVRLCPEARVKLEAAIAADADIQWLQDAVWADARIHQRLISAGLDGDNVLALDTKDGDVNVYVF